MDNHNWIFTSIYFTKNTHILEKKKINSFQINNKKNISNFFYIILSPVITIFNGI